MLTLDNNAIKLVVCDIDGTIAYRTPSVNRFVSSNVIETIKTLRENNIYFVFNTGNSYITVDHIAEQFDAGKSKYTKYLVAVNGNCIFDFSTNTPYIQKTISKSMIAEIQNELDQFGVNLMVMNETADKIYISNEKDKEKFIEILQDEGENSIVFCKSPGDFPDAAQVTVELTNPEFKGEIEFILQKYSNDIDVSWWSEHGLDLNVKDVNKFSGLQGLIEIINDNEGENITLSNVVYFGDQNNDLSVFENHKYSIAMGNAIEEIKDHAFEITDTVQDDGFPNYIKKITNK
ncbi:HAD family hydrolase [Spiroplasma endosymbiont of Othius punctulatus]|uniref:HAD family hydrolase n=1 Tax=Spiroplasma endosymbiont of Othius punctulatus TaxID=3066289 RepID=UPI0030D43EF8